MNCLARTRIPRKAGFPRKGKKWIANCRLIIVRLRAWREPRDQPLVVIIDSVAAKGHWVGLSGVPNR
jgi:hypothetical protein